MLYTLFICTSTFPFLTHSLGSFLTTLNSHIQILNVSCYWSGIRWEWTCCKELEFLFTYSGIIVFLFIHIDFVVSLILYTLLSVIISFLIHMYHVWVLICDITVIMIYFSRYLYLVWVTLGLACIREVFFLRIYILIATPFSCILGSWA